ncbi:protein ECERIFERUM 26-like [Daucus carota subsp. sativus]|uniref:protein ECERIFERUM 26-like n=1 Tax=Daucus carota subsp. sativus TaxID=79200 RepID=UPI0007EFC508|nr:PREDICTED: protein ECERIFERUM 26-like [Daucus carota subsp. sativus]
MTIESSSSSSTLEPLIYNVKLSSVGPGEMTRPDTIHEPTSIDLAMKLHYLKGVYYFKSHEAFASITIVQIKEAMFRWLCQFYVICGRFRRFSEDSGRPYLKCNDCGARLMEAECAKTIEEWLELLSDDDSLEKKLIFGQPIGPQIEYSPNVYLQITKFKCGGISLGLSWAHVLGDVHLASFFINTWGKIMAGHKPGSPPVLAQYTKEETPPGQKRTLNEPLSIKWVDPVGDQWVPSLTTKMESFSFHISATQLGRLQSKVSGSKKSDPVPPFESLCAIIWQCVAKFKTGTESNVVTIVKHDSCKKNKKFDNENQVISIVKTKCSVVESDIEELATLVMKGDIHEHEKLKNWVESEKGALDVIVYGVNLTFVSFEQAAFYELELKGQNPVHASYWVDGIGDGGAVFVLPTSKDDGKGRFVTITLPEKELIKVKHELKENVLQASE